MKSSPRSVTADARARGLSSEGRRRPHRPADPRRLRTENLVTPRYARPRGRSHNTVPVHTIHVTSALTRSPHLEGSASSHRPRGATRGQEGDARVGSPHTPTSQHTHGVPTRHGSQAGSCPPHQYIHSVQSSHGIPAGSPPPVHPLSTIISAAAPVEGGRVGNQCAAAAPPPSEPRGSDSPRGGR